MEILKLMPLQLNVPSMACSACVDTITNAVTAIDPTAKVEGDTKTKIVTVDTEKPETDVRAAIANAGYPVA